MQAKEFENFFFPIVDANVNRRFIISRKIIGQL